jgi:hypothetical protein
MALLDSLYGETPSYFGGLLGEDELKRLQGQAQSQSNLGMAAALLRAGAPSRTPGGGALAIAEGLQMGQQAYKQALNQGLQEKMQEMQIGEQLRKQQEARQIRQLSSQLINPAVAAGEMNFSGSPDQIAQYFQTPGQAVIPTTSQAMPASVNMNVASRIAQLSADPLAAYANLAKLVPDLRKAGFVGAGTQGENPFDIFVADATVPAPLKSLAQQYQKSYASGQLDPERTNEVMRQLATSVQSAQQFAQQQAGTQENREFTRMMAGQGAATQRMLAEEKISAAQEKRETAATGKSEAKTQLTDIVGSLKKNYETLKEQGGIVSTTESGFGNVGARLSSSGLGQAVGGAIGMKTQEERQKIEQTRPLLLNLIKNATGMSAQQMNSNAEMQLYLNAATNPQLSYEANLDALKNLDKLYGLGNVAKDIEKELKNPAKPSGPSKSGW